MVKVAIRFLALIADVTGIKSLELNINDRNEVKLADILNKLYEMFPEISALEKQIPLIILVNGVKVEDRSIVIKEGDEIALMPPASGG